MSLDASWISEPYAPGGCAFSLKQTQLLHEEQSRFQKIEVYETEQWGRLLLLDGCTMVSTRDNFLYHEMMSHPALFTHAAPRRVAIIGGGDCGTLREVLKHPEVEQVTQIDIDARVTRIAERYFPELCASNHDPRARLLFRDGIQWMRDAEPGSLDVVIVDSTDPVGPGEALFAPEFHAAVYAALDAGGLLCQQSESPLLHLPLLERMYASLQTAGFQGKRTLSFPQPIYPSGWWSATLGCKGQEIEGFRMTDAERKTFATEYYNAEIHRGAWAEPEFLKRAVAAWG